MRFALTLLGACWQPDPWTPPPPPPEAVDAMAVADAGDEAGEPTDEGDEGAAGEGDTGEAEGDDVAEAPPPIDPWKGRLLQAPVTLVDDNGKPLLVVGKDVEVEVRAAEPHRLKVFCAACTPPTEGWVQVQVVAPVQ